MDCHNRNNTTSTATNTNDDDDTTTCRSLAVDSAYPWSMNTHVPESSRGHCDLDRTVSNDLLPSQNLHSTLLDRVKYSLGHGWNLVRNGLRLHARSIHTSPCITQETAASCSSVNDRRDKTTSSSSSFVECRVVSCRSLSIVIARLNPHVYATWKSSATSNCISVEPPPSSPKASGRRSFLEDVP